MDIIGIKSKVPYPNICGAGMFPSLKPDRMNEDPLCTEEQYKKLHKLFTGHNLIGFLVICTPEKKFNRKKTRRRHTYRRLLPSGWRHRTVLQKKSSHFAKHSNASIFRSVIP